MMLPLVEYFLQVSILMAVFYVVYYLFLQNERLFTEIRFFLIFSLLLSLILPLIHIEYTVLLNDVSVPVTAGGLTVSGVDNGVGKFGLSLENGIIATYLLILLVLLVRSAIDILRVWLLISKHKPIIDDGVNVVVKEEALSAFTFFNYVVIAKNDYNNKLNRAIWFHEKAHAKQKHWIDLLLVELLSIIFWINPFVWLFRVAIKQTHELLADDRVIARGFSVGQYQAQLINRLMGAEVVGVTNNFNYSINKKRMIMMSKEKSPKNRRLKLLVVVPIVAVVLLLNTKANYVLAESAVASKNKVPKLNAKVIRDIPLKKVSKKIVKDTTERVFVTVEKMPVFSQGDVQKWINKNTKYPVKAIEQKIEEKVYVSFIVNSKGDVDKVKVLRGVNPELRAEALRVVKAMPKWTPGEQRGEKIAVSYTVPISFALGDRKLSKKQNNVAVTSVKVAKARKTVIIKKDNNRHRTSKGKTTFVTVEKMPEFSQGDVQKWVLYNIQYPKEAQANNISGKVYVSFVVDETGKAVEAKVLRGLHPAIDAEAIRVINAMPKWTPGEQRGEKIRVSYTIPISFSVK